MDCNQLRSTQNSESIIHGIKKEKRAEQSISSLATPIINQPCSPTFLLSLLSLNLVLFFILYRQEGSSYATLYLRLLSKLSRTDTLQQILVLVGDMLEGRDDRVQLFKNDDTSNKPSELQDSNEIWPYAPFIK